MRTRIWGLVVAFVGMTSVPGLAQTAPVPAAVKVTAPDKSTDNYRNGFRDGCEHATMGNIRNEFRFNKDFDYHEGWVAGYKSCYPHQTINTNNDPNGPLKGLF